MSRQIATDWKIPKLRDRLKILFGGHVFTLRDPATGDYTRSAIYLRKKPDWAKDYEVIEEWRTFVDADGFLRGRES